MASDNRRRSETGSGCTKGKQIPVRHNPVRLPSVILIDQFCLQSIVIALHRGIIVRTAGMTHALSYSVIQTMLV